MELNQSKVECKRLSCGSWVREIKMPSIYETETAGCERRYEIISCGKVIIIWLRHTLFECILKRHLDYLTFPKSLFS